MKKDIEKFKSSVTKLATSITNHSDVCSDSRLAQLNRYIQDIANNTRNALQSSEDYEHNLTMFFIVVENK